MVAWRHHQQIEEVVVQTTHRSKGRIASAIATMAKGVKIHLVAIYGFVGEMYGGLNLHLLAEVGKHIDAVGLPWLVGGDWNIEPSHMTEWLRKMRGSIVEQEVEKTCYASIAAPTCYDYWVVHQDLQNLVKGTGPDWNGPWATHLAMTAVVAKEPMKANEQRLREPKALPEKQGRDLLERSKRRVLG